MLIESGALSRRTAGTWWTAGRRKRIGESSRGRPSVCPGFISTTRTLSDLQMIASGVFSPLEGFMLRDDYESVVDRSHDGRVSRRGRPDPTAPTP